MGTGWRGPRRSADREEGRGVDLPGEGGGDRRLERESEIAASRIRTAGGRAADGVSEKNGVVPVDIATAVTGELIDARTDFDVRFSASVRAAFAALVAEYGEGVPAPEAWVNGADAPETTLAAPTESPYERAIREAAEKAAKVGAKRLHEWLKKVASEPGEAAANVANWLNKTRAGQKVLNAGGKITNGVGKFKRGARSRRARRSPARPERCSGRLRSWAR